MRRRLGVLVGAGLLLLLCGAGALVLLTTESPALLTATRRVSMPLCGAWEATTGPGLGGSDAQFKAVAALATDNVWAVGTRQSVSAPALWPFGVRFAVGGDWGSYAAHWNGNRWNRVPVPGNGSLDA